MFQENYRNITADTRISRFNGAETPRTVGADPENYRNITVDTQVSILNGAGAPRTVGARPLHGSII